MRTLRFCGVSDVRGEGESWRSEEGSGQERRRCLVRVGDLSGPVRGSVPCRRGYGFPPRFQSMGERGAPGDSPSLVLPLNKVAPTGRNHGKSRESETWGSGGTKEYHGGSCRSIQVRSPAVTVSTKGPEDETSPPDSSPCSFSPNRVLPIQTRPVLI